MSTSRGRADDRFATLLLRHLGSIHALREWIKPTKLQATLEATPWSPMGFETFRRAPALIIETQAKKFVTRNSAGLLVANPTAAKIDTAAGTVVLQVNGSYLPAMKVQKATRAQALSLLRNPLAPSLDSTAAAEARKQAIDDIEFLESLTSSLAN